MKDVCKLLLVPVSDPLYQKIISSLEITGRLWIETFNGEGTETVPVQQKVNIHYKESHIPISMFVKDRDYFRRIEFCRIRWIEASGSYCYLNLEGASKLMLSFNLSELFSHLPCDLFMRVHRSYIVNINYIDSFIGNMICIGKERIPISKQHKREVIARLNILGNT